MLTAHPACQDCEAEGLLTPATEVHHVVPVDSGRTFEDKRRLAYDPCNLRALCHACHVRVHHELGSYQRVKAGESAHKEVQAAIARIFGDEEGPTKG